MQPRKLLPDGAEKKSIYIVKPFFQRNLNCQLHKYRVIVERYLPFGCLLFKKLYLISNKSSDLDSSLMFSILFVVNIISQNAPSLIMLGRLADTFLVLF